MEIIQNIDNTILMGIGNLHNPVLDWFMTTFTHLGDKGFIWIALGVFMLAGRKYRKRGISVLLALLFSLLFTNIIIKNIVMRVRPYEVLPIQPLVEAERSWSFPSGHTSSSFAAAVVLMHYYGKKGIPFLILAILMGFSRIYVLVHYPSDVIGGAVIGSMAGWLSITVSEKLSLFKKEKD